MTKMKKITHAEALSRAVRVLLGIAEDEGARDADRIAAAQAVAALCS